MTQTITLYDLTGADPARRFSPFCWRVKMALAHKGLSVETIPWRFTDKAVIGFSGQTKVPVLVDGATTVSDSWNIAVHLEEAYPDRPSLFGGTTGQAVTRFVNAWADRVLNGAIAAIIVADVHAHLHEQDQEYFRTSREKAFGRTLEEVVADRETNLPAFRRAIDPIRGMLRNQPFLGGDAPSYADYIPFGSLQWARAISPVQLLEPGDPVHGWRDRLLDAFGGLARNSLAYA